jgi:hypothetical protein
LIGERRSTTKRRFVAAALAVVVLVALAGIAFAAAAQAKEDALLDCTVATNPPSEYVSVRWEWRRPGYVCQYLDDRGRVLVERRP